MKLRGAVQGGSGGWRWASHPAWAAGCFSGLGSPVRLPWRGAERGPTRFTEDSSRCPATPHRAGRPAACERERRSPSVPTAAWAGAQVSCVRARGAARSWARCPCAPWGRGQARMALAWVSPCLGVFSWL